MSNFRSELEEMRQEDTQYALFHINKTPELLDQYMALKKSRKSKKLNSEVGLLIAKAWAHAHDDTFGDLFITELELVRWNKLLGLL